MNNRLTITGLVFIFMALHGSYAFGWTKAIDFNDGVVGTSTQGPGGFDDAAQGTLYSDQVTLDGSLSAKMSISEGVTGFGQWGGILDFPTKLTNGDNLWVQFYIYIPSDFLIRTPTNGSLKFVRIRTNTSSGSNAGYNDFQIIDDGSSANAVYRFIKEGVWDIGWIPIGSSSQRDTLLPRDKWFKLELAFSLGTIPAANGGDAFVRLWINDKLIWNGTNAQTLSNSTDYADGLYLFTYWNGDAPKSQSLFIDNIIIMSDTPSNTDSSGYRFIGGGGIPETTSPPAVIEQFNVE